MQLWPGRARSIGVAATALLVLGAGCSGGHTGRGLGAKGLTSAIDTRATCQLIAGLARTGQGIAHANVRDPTTFNAKLAHAVAAYTTALDRIAPRLPSDLSRKVQVLRSAVEQYKFNDAIDARAPLDDWVSQHC